MHRARGFFVPILVLASTSQLVTVAGAQQRAAFVPLDRVTGSRALANGMEIRSGAAIMQITARIREAYGVEVPFDVFFDTPTVEGIADSIAELREEQS